MTVSGEQILTDMENHASAEEAKEIRCIRKYFETEGIIVEYDNLPIKYKNSK